MKHSTDHSVQTELHQAATSTYEAEQADLLGGKYGSNIFEHAVALRSNAIKTTIETHRNEFAQHFTPPVTAEFAVSMFSDANESLRCLDLGAGTGILSASLVMRYQQMIHHLDLRRN